MRRFLAIITVALALLIFSAVVANAQVTDTSGVSDSQVENIWKSDDGGSEQSVFWAIAKGIGSLLLILVLIYGMVWSIKVGMGKRAMLSPDPDEVRIISRTYLAPKKSLTLVKVFDKAILLGETESTISALTEIPGDAGWKDLLNEMDSRKAENTGFQRKLSDILRGGKKDKSDV